MNVAPISAISERVQPEDQARADFYALLAVLGLARRNGVTLVEDHLAALCETMRILIAGQNDRRPASVDQQRAFFERHIASWIFDCCNAIQHCPVANYYRKVAQFTNY